MVDITIHGAGIFGLSIAWSCVRRGASVQIIDPHGPGAGSSGGVVGALAPHVPENWNPKKAFQLESLLMAEAFWTEVAQESGENPGYLRSGRIQPILNDAALDLAHQRERTARVLWQDKAVWRVEQRPEHEWSPQSPTGLVIYDNLSALLHPKRTVSALVSALSRHNVQISSTGRDHGQVLWATGLEGLYTLNATHHRQMGNGVKGQAAVLNHNARHAPQIFVDGLHIIPHLDGTVAVGSTSERDYEEADTTDALLDQVIEKARNALPTLQNAEVLQRWAGVRPRARSRAPMLGQWPDRPGHFIANGGFKIGFGMAPKIADVMANLMLEGREDIPVGFEVTASL